MTNTILEKFRLAWSLVSSAVTSSPGPVITVTSMLTKGLPDREATTGVGSMYDSLFRMRTYVGDINYVCSSYTDIPEKSLARMSVYDINIGESVERIATCAFHGVYCNNINMSTAPALVSIGEYAFYNASCNSINISEAPALVSIGAYAFYKVDGDKRIFTDKAVQLTALRNLGDFALYGVLGDDTKAINIHVGGNEDTLTLGLCSLARCNIGDFSITGEGTVYIGERAFDSSKSDHPVSISTSGQVILEGDQEGTEVEAETLCSAVPRSGLLALFGECGGQFASFQAPSFSINADKGIELPALAFYNADLGESAEFRSSEGTISLSSAPFAGVRADTLTIYASSVDLPEPRIVHVRGTLSEYYGALADADVSNLRVYSIGQPLIVPSFLGEHGDTRYLYDKNSKGHKFKTVHLESGKGLSIKESALRNGADLSSVYLQCYRSDVSVGDSAFENCESLTSIYFPKAAPDGIGDYAFAGCSALPEFKIGYDSDEPYSIGDYAFDNCTSLSSVILTKGLDELGVGVFHGCTSLNNIGLPSTVTEIGSYCFARSALSSISISSPLIVGDCAFRNTAFKTAPLSSFPSGTTFGSYVFCNCQEMTSVTFTEDQPDAATGMFAGCSNLTKVYLGAFDTTIGSNAFQGTGLTEVVRTGTPEKTRYSLKVHASAFSGTNIKYLNIGPQDVYYQRSLAGLALDSLSIHPTAELHSPLAYTERDFDWALGDPWLMQRFLKGNACTVEDPVYAFGRDPGSIIGLDPETEIKYGMQLYRLDGEHDGNWVKPANIHEDSELTGEPRNVSYSTGFYDFRDFEEATVRGVCYWKRWTETSSPPPQLNNSGFKVLPKIFTLTYRDSVIESVPQSEAKGAGGYPIVYNPQWWDYYPFVSKTHGNRAPDRPLPLNYNSTYWHHYAIAVNEDNTVDMYCDGRKILDRAEQPANLGVPDVRSLLTLADGYAFGPGDNYRDLTADVAIFSREMTQEDVLELYNKYDPPQAPMPTLLAMPTELGYDVNSDGSIYIYSESEIYTGLALEYLGIYYWNYLTINVDFSGVPMRLVRYTDLYTDDYFFGYLATESGAKIMKEDVEGKVIKITATLRLPDEPVITQTYNITFTEIDYEW